LLEEAVGTALAPTRFLATLLAGFSTFALLLAVLGLYGVIAYAARQRRRDVAIRIALGADRAEVAGLFLRQGMRVALAGVVLGTAGGYLLGRALAGQLHGVAPGDPATHAALAALLLVTAAAAVWIPARRAAAAEPMRVLREE
jgi:putative ABC transport system permease protein